MAWSAGRGGAPDSARDGTLVATVRQAIAVATAANPREVQGITPSPARSASDTFKRAIMAAHELERVTLENALELTILAAEVGDERWPKLAARWHARFVGETPGMGTAESALVLAAACALGGPLSKLGDPAAARCFWTPVSTWRDVQ